LRYGAKRTQIESETLEKGLGKLNRTIADAATGKNKDAAALFARLGINLRDANGHLRGAKDVLPGLASAFERNENEAVRSAMAVALFGKAGESLIPFLARGRGWMEGLSAETKRFGGLTDKHRVGLAELNDRYEELEKAGSGLSSRLSASLAPLLA